MLKYQTIISQLSDRDKIRMLSDINCLSEKAFRVLGIPEIKVGRQTNDGETDYPSPMALANSWDRTLMQDVANEAMRQMASEDVDLAILPGANIKLAPGSDALSEDVLLASAVAEAYGKAAEANGIAVCASDFFLTPQDRRMLDEVPDERFIKEYIVRPYQALAKRVSCVAIGTAAERGEDKEHSLNAALMQSVAEGQVASGAVPVCRKATAENMVTYLKDGGLFFEGPDMTLEAALHRYQRLKKKVEHGSATLEELQAAVESGKAISPEMLDAAVDRVIDFAHAVQRKRGASVPRENAAKRLALQAARDTIVLLKNDHALPLKRPLRIGLVGDIAFPQEVDAPSLIGSAADLLRGRGYEITGMERGYDIEEDRSMQLLSPALALAANSDVILLFLGFGAKRQKRLKKTGKISIPANQQHLLDALGQKNASVIAILPSEYSPDVELEKYCSAILFAPFGTPYSAQALVEVLNGEKNPCGKLANTVYLHSDAQYTMHETYRMRDGIQTGIFTGYRYYDRADHQPGYVFGHGLSYTEFAYSNLVVIGNKVTFTVRNTGMVAGTEIAQVYVGAKSSAVLRPKKELAAFAKITLEPKERKTVELVFDLPEIYDAHTGKWVKERTEYIVYVGSSISDIHLTATCVGGDAMAAKDEKRIVDYIQSESNILTDDFKLEAKGKKMKKSMFHLIAGGAALLLAIVLKLYCAFARVESLFFDFFAILLGICGIAFFIMEAVYRNNEEQKRREAQQQETAKLFEDAEKIPFYNAQDMFVEEFDREKETPDEQVQQSDSQEVETLAYIDKEQTFLSAAREFEQFAAEKGYRFDADTVKRIFASLASSRLVVVRGMDEGQFSAFMLLLGNYFETAVYMDTVDETYISDDCLLFKPDGHGGKIKNQALTALETARITPQHIHFAALKNVQLANLPMYFSTYAAYAGNPNGRCAVKITTATYNGVYDATYFIPRNLWFVLHVAEGESFAALPSMVFDTAACCTIRFDEVAPAEQHFHPRKFSYYQMEYLTERASNAMTVHEDMWKKIDRLEEFANTYEAYHIGNKRWLGLERFAFVYMACGGEAPAAVDEAVAIKLLPSVAATVDGKIDETDKSLAETIDEIFGEDHTETCQGQLRAFGANKA